MAATSTLHQTATSTPEQFVAGLTDFAPGRSELFATAPTSTSRCMTKVSMRQMSRKAQGAFGNACTTTGRIPTAWS